MRDLGLPGMTQIDIVDVPVRAAGGVNVCCKIRRNVFWLTSMCVGWKRLDLAESSAPQIGPMRRPPVCFL